MATFIRYTYVKTYSGRISTDLNLFAFLNPISVLFWYRDISIVTHEVVRKILYKVLSSNAVVSYLD